MLSAASCERRCDSEREHEVDARTPEMERAEVDRARRLRRGSNQVSEITDVAAQADLATRNGHDADGDIRSKIARRESGSLIGVNDAESARQVRPYRAALPTMEAAAAGLAAGDDH